MDERLFFHACFREDIPCLLQPEYGVAHEVGIALIFRQDTVHPLQDPGVDVSGDIAEISGDIPFDQGAVHFAALVVHLVDDPDPAGDGDLFPCRRGIDDGAQLPGFRPDGIFYVLLKDSVKLVIVHDPLPGKTDDQAAVLSQVDMVDLQKVPQEKAEIILADPVKDGQGQDPGGQFSGRHFAAGGQCAHGLVVEERERQPVCAGRFHKALLYIELDKGDALDHAPGERLGEQGPRLRMVLAHDKPHLRRTAPPSGPAHALQKAGNCERRVDLEGPLEPPDVDAQFQRRRRADTHQGLVVLHFLFRALPVGDRKVAVVDEEPVRLVVCLAVLTQMLAYRFAFFAGVGKNKTLFSPGVFKDIAHAGIRRFGGPVGGRFYSQKGAFLSLTRIFGC